jgi:hypothetical protein
LLVIKPQGYSRECGVNKERAEECLNEYQAEWELAPCKRRPEF